MIIKRIAVLGLVFLCAVFSAVSTAQAATAQEKYAQADACYRKLLNSPEKQQLRHHWVNCIEAYQDVYKTEPEGPMASAGLYMVGYLYDELFRVSQKMADKKEAIDCYERVIKRYPKSSHMPKAKAAIDRLSDPENCKPPSKKNGKSPISERTFGEFASSPGSALVDSSCPPLSGYARINDLRVWSNPSYTRIVIDADKETTYEHRLLKKDPALDKPQRLYIDFNQSKLSKSLKNLIPIDDDLLIDARAGQYTLDSVRVVVDIKSFKTYKIFSLNNPFRIVLDIWGDDSGPLRADQPSSSGLAAVKTEGKNTGKSVGKGAGKHEKIEPSALAKQLSLGVSRIVIDPGHGGKDFGAPGAIKGVFEKDITLAIGKRLAVKIKETLKCDVIMTRTTDRYLTLEERTAIANTKNADLFISIHTNAARNSEAYGIETYFLNLATDDESIMVAARENATSTKNISDLQSILTDLMQNAKINESSRLAASVQDILCNHMSSKYSNIKNKGVKKAPFYVLLGAQMPSILVETSFISNERECARLASPEYQDRICDAIIAGIGRYIKDTNPTAFQNKQNNDFPIARGYGG